MVITLAEYKKFGGRPADVDAFMNKYPAPGKKARKAIPNAYAAALARTEEDQRRNLYESGLATAEKARAATVQVKADLAAAKLKFDVDLAGGEKAWREQVKERALLTRAKVEPVLAEFPPVHFKEPEEEESEIEKKVGKEAFKNWLRVVNWNRR